MAIRCRYYIAQVLDAMHASRVTRAIVSSPLAHLLKDFPATQGRIWTSGKSASRQRLPGTTQPRWSSSLSFWSLGIVTSQQREAARPGHSAHAVEPAVGMTTALPGTSRFRHSEEIRRGSTASPAWSPPRQPIWDPISAYMVISPGYPSLPGQGGNAF